jgi:hypothetical protein
MNFQIAIDIRRALACVERDDGDGDAAAVPLRDAKMPSLVFRR